MARTRYYLRGEGLQAEEPPISGGDHKTIYMIAGENPEVSVWQ